MKRLIQIVAAASLLQFAGPPANAQPPRHEERDERYHQFGRATLDRVRADLSRAERDLRYVAEPDMRRFQSVRENLADFQRKWERGRYEREDLDHAIGGLHALVDRGRLRPRDRDVLADDLQRLRELQGRIERGPRG